MSLSRSTVYGVRGFSYPFNDAREAGAESHRLVNKWSPRNTYTSNPIERLAIARYPNYIFKSSTGRGRREASRTYESPIPFRPETEPVSNSVDYAIPHSNTDTQEFQQDEAYFPDSTGDVSELSIRDEVPFSLVVDNTLLDEIL